MDRLTLLASALLGLAYLTAAGAGIVVALAPRLPSAAQAALAPVTGAALVAAASVLVPLDVPAKGVAVTVGLAGIAVTVACRRAVADALRTSAAPLAVAVAAIVLAAVPALERGNGRPASLYSSTDAYHWVSQARAYMDEPARRPATEHPDRVTYERARDRQWAPALPFGVLQLAWISRADPIAVYAAFGALAFCLLPLVTFAVARGWLEWTTTRAAAAGLLVAASPALLFATHFSWQQQIVGSTFALGAFAALLLAFEREGRAVEAALAALYAAAAVATYRLGFAPYLGVLVATALVTAALVHRAVPWRRAGVFAGVLLVVGAPSLWALAEGLPDFISGGEFSTAFKRNFPSGQLAEGVGLVPHVWAAKGSWPAVLEWGWLAVATFVALAALAVGVVRLRSERRWELLGAGAALTIGGYFVLLLPPFANYLSFKVLSYGVPFLVLLVLTGLRSGPTQAAFASVVAVSAAVATLAAIHDDRVAPTLAASLPADALVSVEVSDPWVQAWALYTLRDVRVSVEEPAYLITEQGVDVPPEAYRRGPATHVVTEDFELRPAR
jgi:hypothetical protein